MTPLSGRILDNAPVVAALLAAVGVDFASLGLAEPAVVAFLLCGIVLMFRSGLKSVPAGGPQAASRPGAGLGPRP